MRPWPRRFRARRAGRGTGRRTRLGGASRACSRPGRSRPRSRDDLALLAVGGFGRGELFPRSDVDLLVLAGGAAGRGAAAPIERFFARLWDEGLNVGHAVRTPAECGERARRRRHHPDQPAGRAPARRARRPRESHAGRDRARADLAAGTLRRRQAAPSSRRAMRASTTPPTTSSRTSRKARADCATTRPSCGWRSANSAARACPRCASPDCSAPRKPRPWRPRAAPCGGSATACTCWPSAPRSACCSSTSASSRSLFGYADEHAQNLAVEQFMQGYYRAAMTVDRLNERLLQCLDEAARGGLRPGGAPGAGRRLRRRRRLPRHPRAGPHRAASGGDPAGLRAPARRAVPAGLLGRAAAAAGRGAAAARRAFPRRPGGACRLPRHPAPSRRRRRRAARA